MTPARFRALAPLALSALLIGTVLASPAVAQFGKNKIQYRDFDWRIYHSTHFDVYYYTDDQELLRKLVSFAESAYDHLSREFDFQIQEPTPLILYLTHSAFEQNNIILNFIPEGVGAFASPVRNRMVMPVDLPDPELMELMLHELTHIFQYHILFGGNLGRGLASAPPTWVMEGMASYMAKDESARDRMFLRDAVVNDRIPSVNANFGGFFAYRFGHAVFDFMEERWGKEGFRDFIIELRNTLGGRVDRAVERTFGIDPEDFDGEFRRWLRQRYLAELLETGEPSDFGRPFRAQQGRGSQELSPVASPGGELVAAFSTVHGDVDIVLFDARERTLYANLTKGYERKYQYLVAQELTLGRGMGRDLAFSADGNRLAAFAKREKGRSLVLFDVLDRKIERLVDMEIEQQMAPAWHPDGDRVAFSGWRDGRFDIFVIDLESGAITNVTDDGIYDGAPTFSPDGESLVFTSVVGGYGKLFRIDLDNPDERFQLTSGESNDTDAVFSADGERIFYTSDASGANNIYELEIASGRIRQHTNSVTGCFQPTVLTAPDGREWLVYSAFWKGRFDLYRLDIEDPITEATVVREEGEEVEPVLAEELPRFEPAIEVAIDEGNKEDYGGWNFFLENIDGGLGVSDDQTFIANTIVTLSDYLGDRRILASFQSIESFQNFNVLYLDLSDRLQWQVHLFDDRDFFVGFDQSAGQLRRGNAVFSQTGLSASLVYPFSFYQRLEFGGGYMVRDIDFQQFILDDDGTPIPIITPREDDFPFVEAALVGDSTVFEPWGPVSGRRWRLSYDYAPDTDESGTLTSTAYLDFRQYLPVTRRSNFAFRMVGARSSGNFPDPFFFGGLDTVRGFDFRSLVGDQGFYGNLEFRFPLIDLLATPLLNFQGIRGFVFLDVGGAWFDDSQEFDFWDNEENRLEDAVSSYGWGFTIRYFGLNLNWSFAKRWDFDQTEGGYESSFWIGQRF